jgi:hypothetical protein
MKFQFKKKWLLQLIGVLIFILIVSKIDIKNTFIILKNTNLLYFGLAIPLSFIFLLIKSWRWQYLLERQGIKVFKSLEIFSIYLVGFYLSLLTPGKIGDFSKVLYLKAKGFSVGKSLVTIFIDRVADILLIGGVAFFGSIFIFYFFNLYQLLLIALGFCFIFILIKIYKRYPLFFQKIILFLIPKNWKDDLKDNLNQFINDFKRFNTKTYFFIALTTLICWLIFYFQVYLLALSLNIKISFLYIVVLTSILSISSLLPISPGGTNIGTRDAILVFFFTILGIDKKELAIALSLLILSLIFIDGLIGLIAWFKMPLPLKTLRNNE